MLLSKKEGNQGQPQDFWPGHSKVCFYWVKLKAEILTSVEQQKERKTADLGLRECLRMKDWNGSSLQPAAESVKAHGGLVFWSGVQMWEGAEYVSVLWSGTAKLFMWNSWMHNKSGYFVTQID